MNTDDTQIIPKPEPGESHFRNVSIRAWLVTMLVATICLTQAAKVIYAIATQKPELFDTKEPLYSLVLIAAGYYFGKSETRKTLNP